MRSKQQRTEYIKDVLALHSVKLQYLADIEADALLPALKLTFDKVFSLEGC